jgi:hypothetical protein
MAITKRVGGVILAAAAAAAVVGATAGPALAATTLTATVNSGGTITATASKTVLSDGSAGSVTCTTSGKTAASVATGSVKNGTYKGASPLKVGSTSKLSFNHCTGPLGAVTNKVVKTPTIQVDSATNSKGETDGIMSGVEVDVSMTECTFEVTGSAPGYFDNSNHTLVMTTKLPVKALNKAQLTIGDVDGCLGVITNGQHPTYSGTYSINLKISIKVTG